MKKMLIISSCVVLLSPATIAFISCSNSNDKNDKNDGTNNKIQISAKNNIKASDLNLKYMYSIDSN